MQSDNPKKNFSEVLFSEVNNLFIVELYMSGPGIYDVSNVEHYVGM